MALKTDRNRSTNPGPKPVGKDGNGKCPCVCVCVCLGGCVSVLASRAPSRRPNSASVATGLRHTRVGSQERPPEHTVQTHLVHLAAAAAAAPTPHSFLLPPAHSFLLTHADAELLEMIERADTDQDGEINAEEFYAIMTKKTFT